MSGRWRGEDVMDIDVIEFELTCDIHGPHKVLVPAVLPRPRHCAHCFLPVTARREVRRFSMAGPLPDQVSSEAWLG
ncbi:MAG: hypothetical protein HS107_14780 [Thermoflexaceae bacterium]|nr:hypothetical protein [Thermoflexaceae bacterium]